MSEQKIIDITKPPLSDARLKCFSDYTPVKDVEVVDAKQRVFKGERVIETGTPEGVMTIIYFRRSDKKDKRREDSALSEIDVMWPEIHIHDTNILGFEFYLIPKVKMLFGYDPASSTILKAPVARTQPGPFGRN